MAHAHSVHDTDTHFTIEPITRQIKTTDQKKVMLIRGDHNSERFTFECPRFIEGHDMMECTDIGVHFVNLGTGVTASTGVYTVTDKELSQESEEVVVFTWLVDGRATRYAGTLSFGICFACVTGGETDYQWLTASNDSIRIEAGVYNGEYGGEGSDIVNSNLKKLLIDKMLPIMKAGIYVPEQSDNIMGFEITLTGYGVSQYSDQLTVKKDVNAEYEETILAI